MAHFNNTKCINMNNCQEQKADCQADGCILFRPAFIKQRIDNCQNNSIKMIEHLTKNDQYGY